MRKPNYRFERTERDRAKQAKKEEKAQTPSGARRAKKGEEPDDHRLPLSDDNA